MTRFTQKQLKTLVAEGIAIDVTYYDNAGRADIEAKEGHEFWVTLRSEESVQKICMFNKRKIDGNSAVLSIYQIEESLTVQEIMKCIEKELEMQDRIAEAVGAKEPGMEQSHTSPSALQGFETEISGPWLSNGLQCHLFSF